MSKRNQALRGLSVNECPAGAARNVRRPREIPTPAPGIYPPIVAGLILIFIALCDIMLCINTDDICRRFFIALPAMRGISFFY